MHSVPYRVYYEDTDAGGVVYYANYLKFAERARTEMLRERGIIQSTLAEEAGLLFVVHEVNMRLHRPARLDDLVVVKSQIKELQAASLWIHQQIFREEHCLTDIEVKIVAINTAFKPTRLPEGIKQVLLNANC